MRTLRTKFYPVYIGENILGDFDFAQYGASSFVIITDPNVQSLAGSKLKNNHSLKSIPTYELSIPEGENSKTLAKAEKILRFMAQHNIDREAVILAFGGGVVGDLAGFVASIYKRGIDYIQIPTSLLAQVDSSHGGKTALNLPEGKNLIGTTYFPLAVVADTAMLGSLTKEQISSGLAEIIKYGMIWDKTIFNYLEKHIGQLSPAAFQKLVKRSSQTKAKITQKDPEEKEFRKILNYGHTVGHALEVASHHALSHGQAVALGMVAEAHISHMLGYLSEKDLNRQNTLIKKLNVSFDEKLDFDKMITLMRRDKKAKGGQLYFVLPSRIGNFRTKKSKVAFVVKESIVRAGLKQLQSFIEQA